MTSSSLSNDVVDAPPVSDLGPLAWVFDELRKSLDSANKALKRFSLETVEARGSDLGAADPAPLRVAKSQLHQVVGALDMVGFNAVAMVVRSMEAAVQRFLSRPTTCTDAAIAKIECAGFALVEYLEAVLNNKPVSSVALFAQYREVQELSGAQRTHPADLWPQHAQPVHPWGVHSGVQPLQAGPAVRAQFDRYVLHVIKSQHAGAAGQLKGVAAGLAAGSDRPAVQQFWLIAAAYFEAVQNGLLPVDVYVKRAASRVLLQYSAFAQGKTEVSQPLVHDLLFFVAQAHKRDNLATPWIDLVREAYGLTTEPMVDYDKPTLGRFDPALVVQARKRINAAKESWSLLAGGDVGKVKQVVDQFGLVGESLRRIFPHADALAKALSAAVDTSTQPEPVPGTELGMEVATAILYLEAVMQDMDPSDPTLGGRMDQLAQRVDAARAGMASFPLEGWMEDLYRRVSDRHTMGSVVGELKVNLSELERSLDQFASDPSDKAPLAEVPQQLAQMKGVMSVLGLDHAAQAVARMRSTVEEMLVDEVQPERAREAGTFSHLANNVSALSFMIDMLNYQPALARKLFVFDAEEGELMPKMGRAPAAVLPSSPPADAGVSMEDAVQNVVHDMQAGLDLADLTLRLDDLADQAALAENVGVAQAARDAAAAVVADDVQAGALALADLVNAAQPPASAQLAPVDEDTPVEDDLRDIFLEEARDVFKAGLAALGALAAEPSSLPDMTTLRRAFHTLKGSSRMVGLAEFGDAAWAMEQVINVWLAEYRPATPDLLSLSRQGLERLASWVDDISLHADGAWLAEPFKTRSEAMRSRQEFIPFDGSSDEAVSVPTDDADFSITADGMADALEQPWQDTVPPTADVLDMDLSVAQVEPTLPLLDSIDFDFDVGASPTPAATPLPDVQAEASDDLLSIDFDSLLAMEAEPVTSATEPVDAASIPDAQHDSPAQAMELLPDLALGASDPALDLDWGITVDAPIPSAEVDSLDTLDALALEVAPQADQGDGWASSPELDAAAPADFELDFGAEPLAPELQTPDPTVVQEVVAEPASSALSEPAHEPPEPTLAEPEPLALAASLPLDDDSKVIGDLRIGVRLFNVFLNEADEWSRRLSHELADWELEHAQPLPESSAALAHSLAGASAAVGFSALSELARALEHALDACKVHADNGRPALSEDAALFVEASEEIRRLLHQFAAGFLKSPPPELLEALNHFVHQPLVELEFAHPASFDADVDEHPVEPEAVPEQEQEQEQGLDVAPESQASEPAEVAQDGASPPALPLVSAPALLPERGPIAYVDDDIDALDTLDADLFQIFEEEALELLPRLGSALRQWVARPENGSARDEVLRTLHTLKGSARLAGALRLGEMAHRMETQTERLGSEVARSELLEPLLTSFDGIANRFEELRQPEFMAVANRVQVAIETAVATDAPLAEPAEQPTPALDGEPQALQPMATALHTPMLVPAAQKNAHAAAVRVKADLLDRLVNQTGEVMITRTRMESELGQLKGSLGELTGNLDRLRVQLRDIELQAESQMQSRLAQAKDSDQSFDPLEFDRFTRVQELTRMMAESVNDVATVQRNLQRAVDATEDGLAAQARQTRELQRDLLRTRMVEFEGISDRLYRVVRQTSKETGKQVRLDIEGGSIEMDRGVLDRMTPAFEHLLRNCVGHGIEMPDVRAAADKPVEGQITIRLTQEGNDVSVVFEDDGAGLNLEKIKAKATSQGVIDADEALTDAEVSQLIFVPGLTTATEVTELSGRGIGMDVVRSDVVGLGGRVDTTTSAGKGTRFNMVLPLTTAVTQVVMLRAGDFSLGVPSGLVEVVRRVSADELQAAYATGQLTVAGESVPFYWAGALLQTSVRSVQPVGRTLPVVIFRSASQRVALHVDEVLGNQEVVVKNLGPQLSRLPGLAAMTVLASGAVALIYNPVALSAVYGDQVRQWLLSSAAEEAHANALDAALMATGQAGTRSAGSALPLVLVVDDSITVRRVTQRLLVREGYRVALAADGLQALEKLQQERPAVVLSDIEMPRMDGFDLVRNIRADVRLSNLPVIMITSRIAEKHREHARELGVDHYLGKPYSEDELLGLVQHYCELAKSPVPA